MMKRVLMAVVLVTCVGSSAFAQSGGYGNSYNQRTAEHRFEIIPLGGYAWTSSFRVSTPFTYGDLDIKDAGFYGVALDVNVPSRSAKEAQLRLLYRRSDSKAQFRSPTLRGEVDASVEYWQIGGVGGIRRGNALPYATFTLGGTRLVTDNGSDWKFSTMLGLGVKYYASPKVGIMLQGTWPFTWLDSWGSVTIGTGGAGVGIGGTGISQWDIGGGLIICM